MLVSRFNLSLHPVAEFVLQDGIRDVGDPLLRQLADLLLDRIIRIRLRILADKLIQPLDLQRLVLRDLEVLALVGSDD